MIFYVHKGLIDTQYLNDYQLEIRFLSNPFKLSNFSKNFPTAAIFSNFSETFKLQKKLSNFVRLFPTSGKLFNFGLSNFSSFPTALSNYTHPYESVANLIIKSNFNKVRRTNKFDV